MGKVVKKKRTTQVTLKQKREDQNYFQAILQEVQKTQAVKDFVIRRMVENYTVTSSMNSLAMGNYKDAFYLACMGQFWASLQDTTKWARLEYLQNWVLLKENVSLESESMNVMIMLVRDRKFMQYAELIKGLDPLSIKLKLKSLAESTEDERVALGALKTISDMHFDQQKLDLAKGESDDEVRDTLVVDFSTPEGREYMQQMIESRSKKQD